MKIKDVFCSLIVALLIAPLTSFASGGSGGDIKAEGKLTALSSTSATVAGKTFVLNSSTKYEDAASNHISRSDFSVGDRVEARGNQVGGLLVANKLELKSGAGASPSSSPNPSSTPKFGDDKGKDKGNNSSNNSSKEKIRAKLRDSEGVVTNAHGKLEYRNRSDKNRKEFKINVEMPLPNNVPAIVDLVDAADENITVDLLRSGNPYATCYLDLNDNSDDSQDDSLEAEFKVNLEQKKSKLKVKRGACDTDLLQAGIDSGMPAVRIGDVIVVRDSLGNEFLRGTVK